MKKRIIMILMTVTVFLGLFVIPAAAADTYGLTVGGVEVTSNNLTIDGNDIPGMTGSATYDPSTSTLTLNGVNLPSRIDYTYSDTLNLVLEGANTVTDGYSGICAINTGAVLNISGTGSLNATGRIGIEVYDLTIESGIVTATGSGESGILTNGNFTVSGGTVTATDRNNGIVAKGNFTVSGGSVTATGGDSGINANGNLTVSGGTVTATGGENGINANGNFTVNGGIVKIQGNSYAVSAGDTPTLGTGMVAGVGDTADAAYANWMTSGAAVSALTTNKAAYIAALVYIADTRVNALNKDDVLGDGKVSYDPATDTLTLNGATVGGMIKYTGSGTLKLVLMGENTVTGGVDGEYGHGIYAPNGSLAISESGTGTLTVTGGNPTSDPVASYGICVYSDITLNSGTVIATGEDTVSSYGIFAGQNINVTGGTLTATGGTAVGDSIGLYAGTITVTGGALTATGGETTNLSYGIDVGSNLTVNGGIVKIQGNSYAVSTLTGSISLGEGMVAGVGEAADAAYANWTNGGAAVSALKTNKAAYIAELECYDLFIAGICATELNKDDILGTADGDGATVKYDPDTNTLTLNGATVGGMIKYTGTRELKLVLTGENTVTGGVDGTWGYGICTTSAALNISGTGSLTVTGADATNGSVGIRAGGALTVRGGTVEATGSAATDTSFGVYASSNVIVGGGMVKAAGGTANLSSGIYTGLGFTVRGGTVTAQGEKWAITLGGGSATLDTGMVAGVGDTADAAFADWTTGGTVDVSELTTNQAAYIAALEFYDLYIAGTRVNSYNKDDVLGTADGDGATVSYAPDTKTLTLNGANIMTDDFAIKYTGADALTITVMGDNTLISSDFIVIYSTNASAHVTINGSGTLTATGDSAGIYVGSDLTIDGSVSVEVNGGTTSSGISAGGNVTIKTSEDVYVYGGDCGISLNGTLTVNPAEGKEIMFSCFFVYAIYNTAPDGKITGNRWRVTTPSSAELREGTVYDGADPAQNVVIEYFYEEYDLTVAGIQVTSENAHDVLGGADGENATVQYDAPNKTLFLNGVNYTMQAADPFIYSRVPNLRIELVEHSVNSLTVTQADNAVIYATEVNVHILGGENSTLTMKGGTLINIGSASTIADSHFLSAPEGAELKDGVIYVGDAPATEVTISYNTKYPLYIGTTQVSAKNCNDVLGDGKVSYDPTTDTLTLNGATVDGMIKYTGSDTLNLVLTGENTVTGDLDGEWGYGICTTSAALNISGTGSLTVTDVDGVIGSAGIRTGGDLTVSGGTVEATGSAATNSSFGVYASGKVIVNGGTVKATGGTANLSSGIYTGLGFTVSGGTVTAQGEKWAITLGSGSATLGTGMVAGVGATADVAFTNWTTGGTVDVSELTTNKAAYIAALEFYDLYIAGKRVNSYNKDDILGTADGDGATVSYDPATGVLTLNGANIEANGEYVIKHEGSMGSTLVIELIGQNVLTGSANLATIYVRWGNLTLQGTGSLYVQNGFGGLAQGIFTYEMLYIRGSCFLDVQAHTEAVRFNAVYFAPTHWISTPKDAVIKDSTVYDGVNIASRVTFKPFELWVNGGGVIPSANVDVLSDGSVIYSCDNTVLPNTHTLTLNGADIESIRYTDTEDLTIVVNGENVISNINSCAVTIPHANVTFKSAGEGASLTMIGVGKALDQGDGETVVENMYITEDTTTLVTMKHDTLYPLYIGGTQVKDSTMDDILGDGGSVQYEESAYDDDGTLTLTNATITAPAGKNAIEYTGPGWLTVYLVGENTVTANDNGGAIVLNSASLSIQGLGSLTVSSAGPALSANGMVSIENEGDLTITSLQGNAIESLADVAIGGMENLTLKGWYGIYSENGDIEIDRNLIGGKKIDIQAGDTGIYAKAGSVTIDSLGEVYVKGNEVGLVAGTDVTLTGNNKMTFEGTNNAALQFGENKALTFEEHYVAEPTGTVVIDSANGLMKDANSNALTKVVFAYDIPYNLYIGGKQVRQSFRDDVFGDGTVKYDPVNNVLTLSGASIADDGILYMGEYGAAETLTIRFAGTNNITVSDGNYSGWRTAIHIEYADLILDGEDGATLNATVTQSENELGTVYGFSAIYFIGESTLIMDGGTVNASVAGTNADTYGAAIGNGADHNMNLVVNGGKLTAIGGNVKSGPAAGIVGNAIKINGGEVVAIAGNGNSSHGIEGNEVTIKDGAQVTATAGDASSGYSIGIGAYDITIEGENTVATATGGKSVNSTSAGLAIAGAGTITIEDATVIATGGEVSGIGSSYGITAMGTVNIEGTADITAKGGKVTYTGDDADLPDSDGILYASALGIGIYGDLNMDGGKLTAIGGDTTVGVSAGIGTTDSVNLNAGTVTAQGGAGVSSFAVLAGNRIEIGKDGTTTVTATGGTASSLYSAGLAAHGLGIEGHGHVVTHAGADVTATGGTAESGASYGIMAINEGDTYHGSVTLDGTVNPTGNTAPIYTDAGLSGIKLTVTFMNGNQVLDRQTVTYGSAATAPNAPILDGYTFMDWDKAFDNVTTPLTVKAVYAVTYDLWIAGKQVNSVNCGDVLGDGKVSYDHATGTLTLNGATIDDNLASIQYTGTTPLTIELIGDNSLTTVIDSAIYSGSADITISGEGTLDITAPAYGIKVFGNLTITLKGDMTVNVTNSGAFGMFVSGKLTIGGEGVLDVEAAYCGLSANGDIEITRKGDMTVTVTEDGSCAIRASYCDLTIGGEGAMTVTGMHTGIDTDGTLTITREGDMTVITTADGSEGLSATDITIGGKGKLTVEAGNTAIIANDGTLTITREGDMTVTANADNSYGMYTSQGDIIIGGKGKLTVSGKDSGICANENVEITRIGGAITATGGTGLGLTGDNIALGGDGDLLAVGDMAGLSATKNLTVTRNGVLVVEQRKENYQYSALQSYENATIGGTGDLTVTSPCYAMNVGGKVMLNRNGNIVLTSTTAENGITINAQSVEIGGEGDLTAQTLAGYYSIRAIQSIKITRNGTLKFSSAADNTSAIGITNGGDIEIGGTGAMIVTGTQDGIRAGDGSITITREGDMTVTASGSFSNGICAAGITIGGTGKMDVSASGYAINMTSGNVEITRQGDIRLTATSNEGIHAPNHVTIGGKGALTVEAGDVAIGASNSNIEITREGDMTVIGSSGVVGVDITIGGKGKLTVEADEMAIRAFGSITVTRNGDMAATASIGMIATDIAIGGEGKLIVTAEQRALDASQGVTITRGGITLTSNGAYAIVTSTLSLSGDADVTATAAMEAMRVSDGITVGENIVIISPIGGYINDSSTGVMDAQGNTATAVRLANGTVTVEDILAETGDSWAGEAVNITNAGNERIHSVTLQDGTYLALSGDATNGYTLKLREGALFNSGATYSDYIVVRYGDTDQVAWAKVDVTYYQYHTVTFYAGYGEENEGLGAVLGTQKVRHGNEAVMSAPVREGYRFDGWNGDLTNIFDDTKRVAMWTKIEVQWGASADGTLTSGTFSEAIEAMANDPSIQYIRLYTDISNSEGITAGTFTLDLNGKSIKSITVSNADVTVTDSVGGGKIKAPNTVSGITIRSGKLTLEKGTVGGEQALFVDAGAQAVINGGELIGNSYAVDNIGTLTVNGGTFTYADAAIYHRGTAIILTGHDDPEGLTLMVNSDMAVALPSGYVWVDQNGTYTATLKLGRIYTVKLVRQITHVAHPVHDDSTQTHYTDVDHVLTHLPTYVSVTIGNEMATVNMGIDWTFSGTFNTAAGATNVFTWTVKESEYKGLYAPASGIKLTGTVDVVNASAQTIVIHAYDEDITYRGTTIDVSQFFLIDADGYTGTPTYSFGTLPDASMPKGEGTLNGSILTVTKAGFFEIVITAPAQGDFAQATNDATIEVIHAEQVITSTTTSIIAHCGETANAHAATLTAGNGTLTYASSDPTVASIDSLTGKITAHKAGTVTITVKASGTYLYLEKTVSYTLTVTHSFGTAYEYDAVNHWHACICGEKSNVTAHNGGNATCAVQKICKDCGQKYGETDETKHNYGKWEVSKYPTPDTAGELTRACTLHPDETQTAILPALNTKDYQYQVITPADCSEPGEASYTYTKDGETFEFAVSIPATGGHVFSSDWLKDQTGHWHECITPGCTIIDVKIAHTSSGAATETQAETCIVCGYEIAPKLPHVHVYDTEWHLNDTEHWHECACGDKSNLEMHAFVDVVREDAKKSDADCLNAAVYFKSCEDCGYIGTETFFSGEPNHHSFTDYKSDGNASCTADGTKTAKCDHCDATDTQTDTGSATGHSYSDYKSDGNASCTADGTKTAKCDHCDATDTQTDTGSATGHSYSDYKSDGNASCTADGTKTAKCDHCDATDTQTDTGSATGHSYSDYKSDGNASCTADGTKTAKCDDCDETDTKQDEGSMLPHAFEKDACTVCGAENPDYVNLTWLWMMIALIAVGGIGYGIYWYAKKEKETQPKEM